MKKRYIDFVPVDKKNAKRKAVSDVEDSTLAVRKGAPKRMTPKKPAQTSDELSLEEIFKERAKPAGVSTGLNESKLGVFEDYQPKFVRTEVAKRPLGTETKSSAKPKTAAKKPAKISKSVEKPNVAKKSSVDKPSVARPSAPKSAMISKSSSYIAGPMITKYLRTDKAEKRPLSSANTKKTVSMHDATLRAGLEAKAEKKPQKSPERIISKPDRDSKAGMIIAVILTIILGAAAGTVAFLLLPK